MKKTIKKIVSMGFVWGMLLCLCLSGANFELFAGAAVKTIASFSGNAAYHWEWTNCRTLEDVKSTGILNTKYSSVDAMKFDYVLVIVSGTESGDSYYFSTLADDNTEYCWCTGSANGTVFDPSNDHFYTRSVLSSQYLVYTYAPDDYSYTFNIFKTDSDCVSYDYNTGKITRNKSKNVYGMYNDWAEDFNYNTNSAGEGFNFDYYYKNNTDNGTVRIFEDDNTDYMFAAYDNNKSYSESFWDTGYFFIWIGHFCGVDGLSEGDYAVKEDTLLCDDSKVAYIDSGATLTINPGATLTVKGDLYVLGTIINCGNIIVENGGAVYLGDADTYGKILNYGSGNSQYGNYIVCQGGKTYINPAVKKNRNGPNSVILDHASFFAMNANLINNGTFEFGGMSFFFWFTGSDFKNCSSGKIIVPSGIDYSTFKSSYVNSGTLHSFSDEGTVYNSQGVLQSK